MTVSSETEDSPDSTPPGRPLRSMHTGQHSIAPESSQPQLGQVRRSSVFMGLTALRSLCKPKATPRSSSRGNSLPVLELKKRSEPGIDFCTARNQRKVWYTKVVPYSAI